MQCHNTIADERLKHAVPTNPANVARAINDLVVALKPFANGAVDAETMDAIGEALGLAPDEARHTEAVMLRLATIKRALLAREKAVRGLRVRDEAHRDLQLLCGRIGMTLRSLCKANGAPMAEARQAKFLDRLLTFADIPHPNASDNLKRLIAVFCS